MQQDTIIIAYVKLPPRADRFYGAPEVEIEIGGKRVGGDTYYDDQVRRKE